LRPVRARARARHGVLLRLRLADLYER
jgi:hypothetical protein